MEFREYWQIMWHRRHVIVPLVAITFFASLIFNLVLPPAYSTSITVQVLAIIPRGAPGAVEYYSPEYYRTLYSEYLSDDLSEIVKSELFATQVVDQIRTRYGRQADVKDVVEAVSKTKRTHRTLKVTIATGSEAFSREIAEATNDVLRTDAWRLLTRDDRQPVQINVLNPPRDPLAPSLLRRLMDVLLHSAVAGVVGIALAFSLHYLDDRIQDEADAERTLGWRVLGAVPAESSAGSSAIRSPAPVLAGLLPRGWRKPAATLAVLLGVGTVTALAAWAALGSRAA